MPKESKKTTVYAEDVIDDILEGPPSGTFNQEVATQLTHAFAINERSPWVQKLVELYQAGPTPEAVWMWAQQNPDKWAKMVQDIAKLAGYITSPTVVSQMNTQNNYYIQVNEMSDAELELEYQKAQLELSGPEDPQQ